jgi:murein L,D-transpeptidase YafK
MIRYQAKLLILTAFAIIAGAMIVAAAAQLLEEPRAPLPEGVQADSIVVEKSKHSMSLFRNGELLRTYRVALGRGGPEPKSQEGDARTPQGAYTIDGRNPGAVFIGRCTSAIPMRRTPRPLKRAGAALAATS